MFRFRLEPVLRYRSWIEERKQLAFADKLKTLLEEMEKRRRLGEMRTAYFEEFRRETAKEEISMVNLADYQLYIFWLERWMIEQGKRVAEAEKRTEEAKSELLEAKKDREIINRAKKRALARFAAEEAVRNQKFLDDVSTVRFIRAARGLDPLAANH
ncbi:MAG: flagellar export protein FliJ [bacterium]